MKYITNIIQSDKVGHFTTGYTVASVLGFFISQEIGLLISIIISFLKELYDFKVRNTKFDLLDALTTSLGGLLNFILWQ